MSNITIRDVDDRVFRDIKAEAVREGVSVGKAVTRAMKFWLDKRKARKQAEKSFLHLRPSDWGPGTEKASQQVDEILYGG